MPLTASTLARCLASGVNGVSVDSDKRSLYNPTLVFGSVAQLVEQRTFNPLVGSSNLPRPTISRLCDPAKDSIGVK